MNLGDIQSGNIVTARVYKRFGDKVWANNYELQVAQTPSDPATELLVLAQTLASWEATFHLTDIEVFRVVISTYLPDSVPYNPNSFLSIVTSNFGQRSYSGDLLPLENCLFVRRVASYGRNGKILYRGVLTESDTSTTGFVSVLTPSARTTLQGLVSALFSNQTFTNNWNMVLVAGFPLIVRQVNFLTVAQNVTFKKRTNAYFDRRNTTNSGNNN